MPVVLPEKNAIVVKLRPEKHAELKKVSPLWEEIQHKGDTLLALPHTLDTNRILRNMDISTKGCEVFKYKYTPRGSRAPWWWQLETAAFLCENLRGYCTSTPRTGKTYSVVMATDFLQSRGVRGVLIIAPLSTLDNVWEDTYGLLADKKVIVVHGTKAQRVTLLATPADVYIINPDGVKVVMHELQQMVESNQIEITVIDELTNYANAKSDRWVALDTVVRNCKYMWGLTGTPGDPEDVYGQVKMVTPRNLPRSKTAWLDMTMIKIAQFKFIPARGHEAHIFKAMAPCIRYDKKDVLTVPVPEVIEIDAPLSSQQKQVYETMRKDMLTYFEGNEIMAVTAGSMNNKLLQISAGEVIGKGDIAHLPMPLRMQALNQLINSTPYKTVIFAAFKGVINRLVDEVRAMGHTCEKIDGDVTGKRRSRLFKEFMTKDDPKVLVCHPETTAFGVELAAADKLVFFGPPLSGGFKYQQAFERLSSSEQKSDKTFVYHMVGSPAERKMFAKLKQGVDINANIVSTFSEIVHTSVED